MAPTPLRDLVVDAMARLDAHITEDNRRFDTERDWRLQFERRQNDKHRENQQALAAASEARREIYRKIDDVAAQVGTIELSTQTAIAEVKQAAIAEITGVKEKAAKRREDLLKWALGAAGGAILALAGLYLETKGVKLR